MRVVQWYAVCCDGLEIDKCVLPFHPTVCYIPLAFSFFTYLFICDRRKFRSSTSNLWEDAAFFCSQSASQSVRQSVIQ